MRKLLAMLTLSFIIVSCTPKTTPKILVFSKTEGFRHTSIEPGIEAIKKLGIDNGFEVDHTEDTDLITENNLAQYNSIVFLSTTGDIFTDEQQYEFQRFCQAGGGFVGIHAAADTEYSWPWYGKLVGGFFNGHPNNPNVRNADIKKVDMTHPSCTHLPDTWNRDDEWYNYKDLNEEMTVLLNLDESSYEGGTNGESHPISWIHDRGENKMFYTGLGHTDETFVEENFLTHLLEGIKYTMGDGKKPDYGLASVAPALNRFQKNVFDQNLNEPMELEKLPNGNLLFVERRGDLKLYDINAKETNVVHSFNVHSEFEDGLLGIALDPNYADNHWIYLFYSPVGEKPVQHVSRFVFKDGKIDTDSEKVVIEIPVQRDECCHSAGSMEFDSHGNLLIAIGDNTNPHQSSGYSPSDGRPGKLPFDARRSSSNTNDLRGKILRITPTDDGSYTIPEGNLFEASDKTRPEIYVMGCRNPYRFFVDPKTDFLYWGDVGPDAGEDGEDRGPRGHDEVNQAREAGYFGWPLFVADNKAYNDYDFKTEKSGEKHNASKPINTSPNNTGLRELPAANKALIYYPYAESEEFPIVGDGGRNAMAGFVYHYDDYPDSPNKLPKYYDGKLFIYEWMRGWIMAVTMDGEGNYVSMERFLPNHKFSNPTDIMLDEKGEIYMLEYGTSWFSKNEDARLVHLKYSNGNRTPVPEVKVDRTMGATPLLAKFDATESVDFDGDPIKFSWFVNDQKVGSGAQLEYTFEEAGNYIVRLDAADKSGERGSKEIPMLVGNDQPELDIEILGSRSFYFEGQGLEYKVNVNDKEDGSIGNGIDPGAVAVNIDYLESGYDKNEIAMGHMSGVASHPGISLMKDSDCYTCHKLNEKSVGPTFTDIANKYRGDKSAPTYLAERIKVGGGGVWGELAMAAHPQLSEEEIGGMVEYILELEEQTDNDALPIAGTHTFELPKGKDPGGVFIMNATYVDNGTAKVDPISTTETMMFRNAMMSATDFDEIVDAMKMDIEPGQFPGVTEKMSIIIGNHNSHVRYDNIDFTGISSVTAFVNASSNFMAGGKLQLILDTVDGDVVGEIEVMAAEGTEPSMISIDVEAIDGVHNLYVKFVSSDEAKPAMTLTHLLFAK